MLEPAPPADPGTAASQLPGAACVPARHSEHHDAVRTFVRAQQVWSLPSRWSAPLTPCWCFHPGAGKGGPGDGDCSAEKQKGIQSKDADSDPTMRLSGLRDENSRAHRTHQGLLNTRRHVLAARQELPGDPGRRRVHVARPLHLTACGVAPPLRLAAPWAFARSRAAPGAVCGVANALCAHRLRAVTRSLAPPGLLSRQCPRLSLARRMCRASLCPCSPAILHLHAGCVSSDGVPNQNVQATLRALPDRGRPHLAPTATTLARLRAPSITLSAASHPAPTHTVQIQIWPITGLRARSIPVSATTTRLRLVPSLLHRRRRLHHRAQGCKWPP